MFSSIKILVISTILACGTAVAAEPRDKASNFSLEVEAGAAWQSRNDVQIPNSASGTRFALDNLTGSGPYPVARLMLNYEFKPKHELRFLYAPFSINETGVLDKNVEFAGGAFAQGLQTQGSYRFDSYRLTYRYLFHDGPHWRWKAGITAKIRDAKIELRQGDTSAYDSNVGLVPLVNLYGERSLGEHWRFIFDFDGLIAPQGRAFDAAVKLGYDLTPNWTATAGYRVLEGGADNKSVYTFAWINYAVLSMIYKF